MSNDIGKKVPQLFKAEGLIDSRYRENKTEKNRAAMYAMRAQTIFEKWYADHAFSMKVGDKLSCDVDTDFVVVRVTENPETDGA